MPRTKYRSHVTVIVRPSVSDRMYPLTAYISGTQIEGQGNSVWEAIEDLFTCGETARVCQGLEREVAENAESFRAPTKLGEA
jgi:hypothetical protein